MKILVTNDDGYQSKGIQTLVKVLKEFGELTIVAPKQAQSGMSMAVSMGFVPIAVKKLEDKPGESWWYLDGTPASCVKYGIDNIFWPEKPDLVVSGINHGSNAATAALYSGTIGATMEGAVNGIPSIGVSLDSFNPDADFTVVEEFLPEILRRLIDGFPDRFGSFYNVNFPNCRVSQVKGVRAGNMGMVHWEKEYQTYTPERIRAMGHTPRHRDVWYYENAEPGEEMFVMLGEMTDNEGNSDSADHLMLADNYITITPQNIDNTDYNELERLCGITL